MKFANFLFTFRKPQFNVEEEHAKLATQLKDLENEIAKQNEVIQATGEKRNDTDSYIKMIEKNVAKIERSKKEASVKIKKIDAEIANRKANNQKKRDVVAKYGRSYPELVDAIER